MQPCYTPFPILNQSIAPSQVLTVCYMWRSEVAQSCPTLCDPMDCSLSGSSIYGIFQARVLEWVAIAFKLWEILKKMRIPDHLSCLLRNLYASQEATVRTRYEATDWLQIGQRVCQDCILSPYLFNWYAEYIMQNAGLDEAQAGITLPGKISITSDMHMTPPLW